MIAAVRTAVEKIDPPQDGFARANNGYEMISVADASTNTASRVARDAGAARRVNPR